MGIGELRDSGFSALPVQAGVYFFYDRHDQLVYVGKSINIRKRVQQHFSSKDRKSVKIQTHVMRVAYEVMGSELISLLYESELIKQHQPLYNRSQRRTLYQFGLYLKETAGYMALYIEKLSTVNNEITSFTSMREAKDALFRITERYGLCQKINGLYRSRGSCFQYQVKACKGACIGAEAPASYNERVASFLSATTMDKFTQLYELEGRDANETGIVYIENGVYRGFGFCPKDTTAQKEQFIVARQDNKDVRRILIRYILNVKEASLT